MVASKHYGMEENTMMNSKHAKKRNSQQNCSVVIIFIGMIRKVQCMEGFVVGKWTDCLKQ
jgi:uncharacterized protein YheU (UPF0270 family)